MKKTYIIPVSRTIELKVKDNILVKYSLQPANKNRNPEDVSNKMQDEEGNTWYGL